MQITPKGQAPIPTTTVGTPKASEDARNRAIAILQGTPPPVDPQVPPQPAAASEPPPETPQQDRIDESPKQASLIEATEKKVEDPLAKHYVNLAKKERALRARQKAVEAELKAKEDAQRAREIALAVKESEYGNRYIPRDKITSDPLGVLSELGLTYDQLTNFALNAPKPEDVARDQELKRLQDEIKSLKDTHDKAQKSQEEAQTRSYQQAKRQMLQDVTRLVSTDTEFETVKTAGRESDVVELIERTFDEDGYLMGIEEATKFVEDYLVEEVDKLSRLSKIQKRLQVAATPPKPGAAQQPQTLKTLTNNMSTPSRPLSARDRAILAFKGELK